jgi:prepilin-type N-terminal cleavage/methylation domain-containing protein
MQITKNKAFTLVELLVVITILAIISVVAYQNFWWAVDKAVSGRKISDVSTIEVSLQQYKVDKNSYPAVWVHDAVTNMWGYNSSVEATPSNTIDITADWAEILSIDAAAGGWKIMNIDNSQQIWAKGTISQTELTKRYLTKDLYDPEVWDEKENTNNKKLIELGLWRYVYGVYKKPTWTDWGTNNKNGTYYNIAYTVKKEWTDTYITKIVWDYDSDSCFENASNCPSTLIWSQDTILIEWQEQGKNKDGNALTNFWSTQTNQWIPYPVSDFE